MSVNIHPIVELTPARLQFLHGDLGFELRDIVKMTGWPREAVNALVKSAGIERRVPAHRDWGDEDWEALQAGLGLTFEWKAGSAYSQRPSRCREALMAKALRRDLDWNLIDQFIAELPRQQDEEERRCE